MPLSGLHLLLTYQCTLECDHCFVWGSPEQRGTMSARQVEDILGQAEDVPTVETIYFEGGEPFLFYSLLLRGVRSAAKRGFHVGIVSNGYWATSADDAEEALRPFAGLVQDLSVSSDLYHGREDLDVLANHARVAAKRLGIPAGVIRIAPPESPCAPGRTGQLPPGESAVMFRGRAAERLASRAPKRPWTAMKTCPYENLRDPGRVHIDGLGYVHACDGIAIGNLFETPLRAIVEAYDPEAHPIIGPLLAGGPAELARRFHRRPRARYADACHLCYETRAALRGRVPDILAPDAMYGVPTPG